MATIKKVVIPIDFSSNMNKVIDYGVSIANVFKAKIVFLHVVDDFKGYDMLLVHPSFKSITNDLQQQAKKQMDDVVDKQSTQNNEASGHVAVGYATDEIISYAKKTEADLIIIGTHGNKGIERILMGSTASQVVKKAPCPVLVFNPFT